MAAIVTAGAIGAHSAADFNRWVGWATIAALPVAAIGVLLVVRDKATSAAPTPQADGAAVEDELAAVVLAQAEKARARLIGVGEPGDTAANVRFVKGSGRFREVGGARAGELVSVLEYYQSLSPGRLVVLGEPGAGKTVLVMELLIRLLEVRRQDTSMPVPLLISAAAYDTRLVWDDWLAVQLALRFSISNEAAVRLVRDGRILPVVDGVDEMDPAGEPERARVLVEALNASMRGREKAPVVVSCRHGEYQALVREIDRATHIEMLPLTSDEAAGYLQKQFLNQAEKQRWEQVLACLHASPNGLLSAQLTTPWRLTLALAAFRDEGDPSSLLPPAPGRDGVAAAEYAQRVDSLLLSRYVSSAVRMHGRGRHYTQQHVQRWLTALADGLAWQARNNSSATDIQLDQWWQPTGRKITRFAHIALTAVPGLAFAIAFTVTRSIIPAVFAAVFLFQALIAAFDPQPSQLKIRLLTTGRSLSERAVGLASGLAIGLAFGLACLFTIVFVERLGAGQAVKLAVGFVVAGCVSLVVMGVLRWLVDSSPHALTPRDVIRADGYYGLTWGLTWGIAAALPLGIFGGLAFGLTVGLTYGLVYGLTSGGGAWTRYQVCIAIIAVRQQGPLRFGAFLDWAQQAGLLRISGIAYQFRHRQLQDWLESRDNPVA